MTRSLAGSIATGMLTAATSSMPVLAAVIFAAGITASLLWGLS